MVMVYVRKDDGWLVFPEHEFYKFMGKKPGDRLENIEYYKVLDGKAAMMGLNPTVEMVKEKQIRYDI